MTTLATKRNKVRSERSKPDRLEARVSKEQKELFQLAADIQGRSLTDFVIVTLQNAAKQTVQEHELMTLTAQDRKVFVEALLNPPEPSAKLQSAAQRYKQSMGI